MPNYRLIARAKINGCNNDLDLWALNGIFISPICYFTPSIHIIDVCNILCDYFKNEINNTGVNVETYINEVD